MKLCRDMKFICEGKQFTLYIPRQIIVDGKWENCWDTSGGFFYEKSLLDGITESGKTIKWVPVKTRFQRILDTINGR